LRAALSVPRGGISRCGMSRRRARGAKRRSFPRRVLVSLRRSHISTYQHTQGVGMNKISINLQDVFLNQVRKDKLAVTIYMTNGFQLKGHVKGFDNFTVVLDSDGKQQLIYKHAISTVSPVKPVNMIFNDNRESSSN
jgi:host factor-I protein